MSYFNSEGIYITHFDTIGYLAIVFSVLAFISKEKQQMRVHGGISTLLFGTSIYFYQGFNGFFVTIVSLISKILSYYIDEKKLEKVKYLSFGVSIVFYLFFNTEGYSGIFPSLSLVFIVFADMQSDIMKMKYWYYGSAFSWLIYGIILNSLPAIIFDVIGILALTYSIYKIKKANPSRL